MTVETNNISKETYLTAGAGALVGGLGANAIVKTRLHNISKNAVKAFNQTPTECDSFVKKYNNLLTKATSSKKGFFGKVNIACEKLVKDGEDITEAIKKSTSDIIDGYRNRAARQLNPKLSGEKFKEGINALTNKSLTKDVYKSFKNVCALQTGVIIAAATALGTIGACVVKALITKGNNPKEAIDQTNKNLDDTQLALAPKKEDGIEVYGAKDEFKTKITKS